MRFVSIRRGDQIGLAVAKPGGTEFRGLFAGERDYPGDLAALIAVGPDGLGAAGVRLQNAPVIDMTTVQYLPPLPAPGKIICVGLNYADHSAESGFKVPTYPTIFGRFASSLIGHNAAIVRPLVSEQLDYEGEFVAVIGTGGREISRASALSHIAGYSLFNDASIRDYQFKAPQWTMGKNFDDTGAFGPWFVTADDLPPGAKGLRLQTRLNGNIVQDTSTDDLIFDVASLVSILSEAFTLEAGDIIVTGTPGGVGVARTPPLWMKPGDLCEIEMDGLGVLSNRIVDQVAGATRRVA